MATLYKRHLKNGSYVYYINYMLHGRFRMKSTGTRDKKLAEEIKKKLEEDLIRVKQGLTPLESIESILLSDFTKLYLNDRRKLGKAPRTIGTDARALKGLMGFAGACNLASITEAVALRYRDHKLETVKPATVSIEFRSLRAAFNWAVEKPGQKYLRHNPFKQKGMIPSVKGRRIPMCLKPDERQRFFGVIDNIEHERLFKFMLLTGCRRGEAANLSWDDVDLEQKQITLRKTKTRKDRVIPVNLELMQIILSLDRTKSKPFEYIANSISRLFRQYAKKAGLRKDLHLHCLRHTAATDLVRLGVPLNQIKDFLGHSSVKITEIYLHTLPEDLRRVAESLTCAG